MKKLLITLSVLGTSLLLSMLWWNNAIAPVDQSDKTERIFIITPGQGIRSIASQLKEKNLIKDPVAFLLLIKKLRIEEKIQAGDFRLSPSQGATEIAQTLTHGTLDIWVTIKEGVRGEEISDLLKNRIPTFEPSWTNELIKEEGYLFPDTYLIPKSATISTVLSILRGNFEKNIQTITLPPGFTQKDIVIIASLIEREAKFEDDRPIVSSVIHNRLKMGMPLQVDATVQYLLGYQPSEQSWWKQHLSLDDLKRDSPYNTYQYSGLPPTPIANAGLSSLKAAVNPARTDYLYYVSDKSGKNHYAKTLEEHNSNIKKYGL